MPLMSGKSLVDSRGKRKSTRRRREAGRGGGGRRRTTLKLRSLCKCRRAVDTLILPGKRTALSIVGINGDLLDFIRS